MNAAKLPSQRQLRVGETVRKALSDCLIRGEVADPVLQSAVVSISEVKMSPDLKIATVYVAPLGPQDLGAIVKALAANAKFLRGRVARALTMKFTPNLRFLADDSFDEYQRIDQLMRSPEVKRDLDKPADYREDDV
ncbi:MAG: 30S ribosome-binding factor RbfA [Pseudomonadota bacterium]